MNDLHQAITKCINEGSAKMINEELKFKALNVALVPREFELQSLEKYMPAPSRKKAIFSTSLIESFAEYCKNELDASDAISPACFINDKELKAITIFDTGTIKQPQHCENNAVFLLQTTQEYDAITAANNNTMPQLDFTYWLEDYRPYVHALYDSEDEVIDFKKAIHALRKITFSAQTESIHTEDHLSSEKSGFARIEAKSGSEQNLPAEIAFKCKPSPDLDEISIIARIVPQNHPKGVLIKLQLIQFELIKQQLAKDFQALIKESLKDMDIQTYIGIHKSFS